MGDEVIGHVSALHYSAALDTPKNAAFVKAYRSKYGKVPSYYSENNYTTAKMIDEVIKKNGGKYPGAEEFIKQLSAMKFDAPRGPVSFDEMRNPVQNIYIKKVEKKKMFGYDKEELWNTVIKTYPNVSQFGQFKKASSWRSRSTAATIRPASSATRGPPVSANSRERRDACPRAQGIVQELRRASRRARGDVRSCPATARPSSARTAPARPRCST